MQTYLNGEEYTIGRVLREGGASVVRLATNKVLQQFALKIFKTDAKSLLQFKAEYTFFRSVTHPGIINMIEGGVGFLETINKDEETKGP